MVLTTELLGIKNSLAEKREKKIKADNAKEIGRASCRERV